MNVVVTRPESPPGYARIRSASLPTDWTMSRLGDCGEVVMGQSPPGASYNQAWVGHPLINGPTEFTDLHPIKLQWTTKPARLCEPGDLLICVRGSSTGRTNYADDTYAIGRGVAAIRAKGENCTKYVSYQVISSVSNILASATGSTFPSVDGPSFRQLFVPLPPPAEQRAIAEALSDVDGLLGALETLVAKKRAIKQAAMQQLLTGKTRLPGFTGAWETKRLGEIASIRDQKVLPSDVDLDTPCVELDHIEPSGGRLLGYSTAQNSTSSKYRFFAGDVLFGRLRSYLRKFWHADRDGICTTEIWPLMVDIEQADSGFLFAIVQSDFFIATANISYGTHMPRADWDVTCNFEVRLPQVREQRAIVSVLSDVDSEIATLQRRRDKTRAIKQGMMQELLTGRVRLAKPDGTTEA